MTLTRQKPSISVFLDTFSPRLTGVALSKLLSVFEPHIKGYANLTELFITIHIFLCHIKFIQCILIWIEFLFIPVRRVRNN